jgi:hypothetical protein
MIFGASFLKMFSTQAFAGALVEAVRELELNPCQAHRNLGKAAQNIIRAWR